MIQAFLQLVMWFVTNRFSVLSKITVNLSYVVCLLEIKKKKNSGKLFKKLYLSKVT